MHFVTHWNVPTGKFDVLLCFQKTIGRMVQLFRAMEEISAMSHTVLRKSHILFQITLNFVLCAFQFLAYFGLCVISRPFGFYAMLCAAVPVAALLITSAGGYLSYRLYKNGKKLFASAVFFQCASGVISLLLYRNYLLQLSVLSPAKWILTPYFGALIVIGVLVSLRYIQSKMTSKVSMNR